MDPKNFDARSFVDIHDESCIIPPNAFALARTVEYFRIPRDVLSLCVGKSTYARCGIIVNVTPLEPEWEGHVTLEFSNTTSLPAKIYANEGVAQLLFLQSRRGLRDVVPGPGRQVPRPARRAVAPDLKCPRDRGRPARIPMARMRARHPFRCLRNGCAVARNE